MSGELLEAALRYLPRTIPLVPGDKRPAVAAWPTWTATREGVEAWWVEHPTANVGIRTGAGLVVLDVDTRHDGPATLARLEAEHGALPLAPEVATGGNGRHIYFRGSRDLASFDLGPGVEVKAAGRQVVAPPSVHPCGRLYVWHPGRPSLAEGVALLPAWVAQLAPGAARPERGQEAQHERRADPLRRIPATSYVPLLSGRRPDARGYIACPLPGHEDRTPSLKVYADPERGWRCYGCERGGDVYTFAALLGGFPVPLRGRDFLTVRGVLLEHLGSVAA